MSLQVIIKNIMKEYDKLRLIKQNELEANKKLVYSTIPRIREIDEELNKTSILLAKSLLSNPSAALNKDISLIQKKNLQLQNEKQQLLAAHDFDESFLTLKYFCNNCHDTGYIGSKRCSCLSQRIINELYKQSNLKTILNTENFDTFNFNYFSDEPAGNESFSVKINMQMNYKACLDFANNFDTSSKDLLLIGEPGLGKTFLCNCIAKELLDKGKVVLYQTSPNLFSEIESLKQCDFNDPKRELIQNKINLIYSCDLLLIDDLGTESNSLTVATSFFNIINTRMLENRRTVISSNLSLNEIFEIYSKRIASRILGNYKILRFYGNDLRLEMKKSLS